MQVVQKTTRGISLVQVLGAPPCEAVREVLSSTVIGLHLERPLKVVHRREDERFERTYHPGQLTCIPAGMDALCSTTGEASFIHLRIDPSAIAEFDATAEQQHNRFVFEDRLISRHLAQLAQVTEAPDFGLRLETAAIEIWNRLLAKSAPKPQSGLGARAMGRVRELLHARMADGVSLNELAAAADVSPRHFARLFERTTSQTPHRYLLELRISRAKELLEDPQMRILDVALAVGYENPSHFARAFTRATGLTPRKYRARAGIPSLGR